MEGFKDPHALLAIDTDAGILNRAMQRHVFLRAVDQCEFYEDLAALGEFDSVADEVDQHLPQPGRVAGQMVRHLLGDEIDEFDTLAGAALAEQIGDLGNQLARIEIDLRQFEPAGLDLRQIEDVVDDADQRLARSHQIVHELGLSVIERGCRQQVGGADDAVHRRAYLVTHRREELGFGVIGCLGLLARLDQFVLGPLAFGDLGRQALRQLDLPSGKGGDQGDRHDQPDEDGDQHCQEHRRG